MRSKIFIAALFILSIVSATDVSGVISSNTTWSISGSPYTVTGNVLVNSGVTLTIEAGVTVKFDADKSLQINGELIAQGTSSNKITFTSNQSSPAAGDWGRIFFSESSNDAVFSSGTYQSGCIMEYCDISYGGGTESSGQIHADRSHIFLKNCTVKYSGNTGVYVYKSSLTIESTDVKNSNSSGVGLSGYGGGTTDLSVNNCTFSNNAGSGLYYGADVASGSATIENSEALNNAGTGFSLNDLTRGVTLNKNIIFGNNRGVWLDAISTANVQKNDIFNNTSNGVECGYSGPFNLSNNIIYNNGDAIDTWYSGAFNFSNNSM